MPGAPSPFIDTWAPAQFVYGSSGGAGPVRSPDAQVAISVNGSNSTQPVFDTQLNVKVAGTVILALIGVFVLQAMGFRFVVAVGG